MNRDKRHNDSIGTFLSLPLFFSIFFSFFIAICSTSFLVFFMSFTLFSLSLFFFFWPWLFIFAVSPFVVFLRFFLDLLYFLSSSSSSSPLSSYLPHHLVSLFSSICHFLYTSSNSSLSLDLCYFLSSSSLLLIFFSLSPYLPYLLISLFVPLSLPFHLSFFFFL